MDHCGLLSLFDEILANENLWGCDISRMSETVEECLEKIMEEIAYLDDNCSEELSELKSAYARILKLISRTL